MVKSGGEKNWEHPLAFPSWKTKDVTITWLAPKTGWSIWWGFSRNLNLACWKSTHLLWWWCIYIYIYDSPIKCPTKCPMIFVGLMIVQIPMKFASFSSHIEFPESGRCVVPPMPMWIGHTAGFNMPFLQRCGYGNLHRTRHFGSYVSNSENKWI